MTEGQIIEKMAQAMADAVKDPSWSHYLKPARAAFWVAKDHLTSSTDIEQARAGAQPQQDSARGD